MRSRGSLFSSPRVRLLQAADHAHGVVARLVPATSIVFAPCLKNLGSPGQARRRRRYVIPCDRNPLSQAYAISSEHANFYQLDVGHNRLGGEPSCFTESRSAL